VKIVLSGDVFRGIWIAFIGWFLEKAASSSYRQLAVREMLQGVKVSDVMVGDCLQLPKDLTIRELVDEYLLHTAYRCFPVVDDNRVLGVIDLRGIKEIPRERWNTMRVAEAMIPFDELKSVHTDDDLYMVMRQMAEERVDQIPVVENGQLMGVVTRDNLMDFMHTR
ncbi:CBS domain-containing protein, partial [Candidatus Poribacteria bacterium]